MATVYPVTYQKKERDTTVSWHFVWILRPFMVFLFFFFLEMFVFFLFPIGRCKFWNLSGVPSLRWWWFYQWAWGFQSNSLCSHRWRDIRRRISRWPSELLQGDSRLPFCVIHRIPVRCAAISWIFWKCEYRKKKIRSEAATLLIKFLFRERDRFILTHYLKETLKICYRRVG